MGQVAQRAVVSPPLELFGSRLEQGSEQAAPVLQLALSEALTECLQAVEKSSDLGKQIPGQVKYVVEKCV